MPRGVRDEVWVRIDPHNEELLRIIIAAAKKYADATFWYNGVCISIQLETAAKLKPGGI